MPTRRRDPGRRRLGSNGADADRRGGVFTRTCGIRLRPADPRRCSRWFLATRPGSVGYVLRDRKTGATYRNSHAGQSIWTASTIKLAMIVDLLTRQRAGTVALSDSDRNLMAAMMHSSDDDAADALWARYGGGDHRSFNADFPRYGMTDLAPQPGFSDTFPYWGFQKSTANDLDRLINYTLTQLTPADTAAIVDQLQHVAPNQQWGVWGAGPAMFAGQ